MGEPYHCLLTVDSLAVWRRLGWARPRPRPAVDNGLSLRSTLIDWSTVDMCIPWQLTCVFLIRSIDNLHNIISFFDRSTIDLCLRYGISRQTTFAIVIWVKSNYIVYGYRKYYCYGCIFTYFVENRQSSTCNNKLIEKWNPSNRYATDIDKITSGDV